MKFGTVHVAGSWPSNVTMEKMIESYTIHIRFHRKSFEIKY